MANVNIDERIALENFPVLSPGEIHVWKISTDTSSTEYTDYLNVLSNHELSKVHFFKSEQAKNTYVVSQGALRKLLSGYLNIPPHLVKIGRMIKGKPFSLDDGGLHFNLSNSGKIAIFAFTYDKQIGIDIEQIRPLPDLDDLINKNFTSREQMFINAIPEERAKRFFRLWTIKESYLKAIGEGMRLAPENVEFSIDQENIKLLSVKGVFEHEDWNFKEFSVLYDYVCTITYGKDNSKIKHMELN